MPARTEIGSRIPKKKYCSFDEQIIERDRREKQRERFSERTPCERDPSQGRKKEDAHPMIWQRIELFVECAD